MVHILYLSVREVQVKLTLHDDNWTISSTTMCEVNLSHISDLMYNICFSLYFSISVPCCILCFYLYVRFCHSIHQINVLLFIAYSALQCPGIQIQEIPPYGRISFLHNVYHLHECTSDVLGHRYQISSSLKH